MNKVDFKCKVREVHRLVHDLKMQEGVDYFTALYDDLNAAQGFLFDAMLRIDQYEHE